MWTYWYPKRYGNEKEFELKNIIALQTLLIESQKSLWKHLTTTKIEPNINATVKSLQLV